MIKGFIGSGWIATVRALSMYTPKAFPPWYTENQDGRSLNRRSYQPRPQDPLLSVPWGRGCHLT